MDYPPPLTFTAPANPANLTNLADTLNAAGYQYVQALYDPGTATVHVAGWTAAGNPIGAADETTIAGYVTGHTGDPTAAQQQAVADTQRLADLRAKVAAGDTLTADEQADAVRLFLLAS